MTNFGSLEAFLDGNDSRPAVLDGKRKGNTVIARRGQDAIAVVFHGTDVVTHYRNGDCVLRSGGWETVTTKRRIAQFSRAYVHQSDWIWYVGSYQFFDGMRLDWRGELISPEVTA